MILEIINLKNSKRKYERHYEWISQSEVAKRLDVSDSTVSRWRKRELIPAHRRCGVVRFDWIEVDKWFRKG